MYFSKNSRSFLHRIFKFEYTTIANNSKSINNIKLIAKNILSFSRICMPALVHLCLIYFYYRIINFIIITFPI